MQPSDPSYLESPTNGTKKERREDGLPGSWWKSQPVPSRTAAKYAY